MIVGGIVVTVEIEIFHHVEEESMIVIVLEEVVIEVGHVRHQEDVQDRLLEVLVVDVI